VPNPAPWNSVTTSSQVTSSTQGTHNVKPNQDVYLAHSKLSLTYDPVHVTAHGRFYSIDGLAQASPGRPIQPKTTVDLEVVPGLEPRGVLVLAGTSTTDLAFNPVIAHPVPTSTLTIREPDFAAQAWFPSSMFAINRLGVSPRLVAIPAQFRGTQTLGQERRFTQIEIAVSYSDSLDQTPPVIWRVGFDRSTKQLSVATGDASGIEQVWATFSEDGDVWQSIELTFSAYTYRWEGALPVETDKAVFVIQAMDGAGNVSHSGNKGHFFGAADTTQLYLPLVLNQASP
jgi:hypothetical protein